MTSQCSQGFSLIEILISVLIITVGILGVAAIQLVSLQYDRDTIFRDRALLAGNDILERMRANVSAAYSPSSIDALPAPSVNCVVMNCDIQQLAEFDISQWKCNLNPFDDQGVLYQVCRDLDVTEASLPKGQGAILKVGLRHEVKVSWHGKGSGPTNTIILRSQTKPG